MGHVWQTSESKTSAKQKKGGPRSRPVTGSKAERRWDQQRKRVGTAAQTPELYMAQQLEKRWGRPVNWSCSHCLHVAFADDHGYVTDEELITSSNNRLRHK